ncbi:MAG: lipopolysaccharide biosynthesis protein RfbH [Thermodesulfobium sp.]
MESDKKNDYRDIVFKSIINFLDKKGDEKFIPGKTWIRYAGRVFDKDEYLTLADALLDGWLTAGRYAEEFEFKLSKFLGIKSSSLVNSGSSANLIALTSLTSPMLGAERLSKGDEVITVAAGFPTTVNPIIQNNLIPVFLDIEEGTYNINPDLIEQSISEKTRAIMIAHTLGNPFDLDKVMKIAKDNNLFLIEDNCDALGSEYGGKKTGTFGHFSTLSFYPAHHITMGEGGAVNTDNLILERIARSFRDWGRDCYCKPGASNTCGMRFTQKFGNLPLGYDHKYVYSHIGYNLKVTDLQAAVGVAQLRKLESFTERRRYNFNYLLSRLREFDDKIEMPRKLHKSNPSWFAFPLTVREDANFKKNELINFLERKKIMTRPIFAGNLTKQPAYLDVDKRIGSELKVTDKVMNNSFFIGVYPGINDDMLEYIGDTFEDFMRDHK